MLRLPIFSDPSMSMRVSRSPHFGDIYKQLLNTRVIINFHELSEELFQPSSAGEYDLVRDQGTYVMVTGESKMRNEMR